MAKIIPISRTKPERSAVPAEAAARGDFYTADDGTRIYFDDTGGPGTPIFFVYGLGCTVQHFKYARHWFRCGGYRQVWVDYRGQGKSERSPAGMRQSMRRIADDIGGLCTHLDLQDVVLWGQSLGGLIAMRVAERYAERIGGLLIQGSPIGNPADQFPARHLTKAMWSFLVGLNQFSNAPMRWFYDGFSRVRQTDWWPKLSPVHLAWREVIRHNGFNPHLARTSDIEEYISCIAEVPFDLFLDMALDLEQFELSRLAPNVKVPALVIAGRHDGLIPLDHAEQLADLLPQGEIWVVEHGSHCPHFDDPTLVHRRVLAFLAANGLNGRPGKV